MGQINHQYCVCDIEFLKYGIKLVMRMNYAGYELRLYGANSHILIGVLYIKFPPLAE